MPGYQPVLMGSLVVCTACAEQGAPPLVPRWLRERHDEWHARQAPAAPVLEEAGAV